MHFRRFLVSAMTVIMIGAEILGCPVNTRAARRNQTAGIASITSRLQRNNKKAAVGKKNYRLLKQGNREEVRTLLGIDEEEADWLKNIAKDDSNEKKKKAEKTVSREKIVDFALSFVGKIPYVYGGDDLSSGVDCSGFVQQVFKTFGIDLPRTSGEQGSTGKSISSSEMQPGDLIYYGGHISIYIGNGKVVHASNRKTGIKVSVWNYRSVRSIRNVIDR